LRHYLRQELAELAREGVRLRVIGNRERFDADLQAELVRAETTTRGNSRLNLNVALSYGSRDEIVTAARAIAAAAAAGRLDPPGIGGAARSNRASLHLVRRTCLCRAHHRGRDRARSRMGLALRHAALALARAGRPCLDRGHAVDRASLRPAGGGPAAHRIRAR